MTSGWQPIEHPPGDGGYLADHVVLLSRVVHALQAFTATAFGAVGDGVTDDTAAIQAALNAAAAGGGGVVFLPAGIYKVTATLTIPASSVALVGAGSGADPGAIVDPAFAPATKILWAGGASFVISASFVQAIRLEHFAIDGGGTATRAVHLDCVQYSTFRRLGVRNMEPANGIALYTTTTRPQANAGTHWNVFEQIDALCPTFLFATGNFVDPIEADTTLNTFSRCMVSYGSTATNATGIILEIADNNLFMGFHMFRRFGTGYGVEFGARARGNKFIDLDTHLGGVVCRAPDLATWSNEILGYKRGNGSPLPALEAGARLTWTENSANSTGWHVEGFGGKFGVGTINPLLANSGDNGIDVLSVTEGKIPEVQVRVAPTIPSTSAAFVLVGRDVAAEQVKAQFFAGHGGSIQIGSATNHPLFFLTNNIERMRLLAGGELVLGAGGTGPRVLFGAGSPEGAVTAPVGSTYQRTDGGASTSLYVKESGAGNTGWVAK